MKIAIVSVTALLVCGIAFGAQKDLQTTPQSADSTVVPADSAVAAVDERADETVIAYYFHGNYRCATCLKLEAYS